MAPQVEGHHGDLEVYGGAGISADVKQEEDRVKAQLNGPLESRDAVVIQEINKVRRREAGLAESRPAFLYERAQSGRRPCDRSLCRPRWALPAQPLYERP